MANNYKFKLFDRGSVTIKSEGRTLEEAQKNFEKQLFEKYNPGRKR